ncbi:MAG: metallophosphoesterase [Candidatus Cloacimonadota bacterium]|nr:metallophosphoesterase [Candidatus Cloacimonadota bacterium]
MNCFFVTDLHGKTCRYQTLINKIKKEIPDVVLMGGDLLPGFNTLYGDFIKEYLIPKFEELKKELGEHYPQIFIIMGNDDPRIEEEKLIKAEKREIWNYLNEKKITYKDFDFYGYAYVPPTPFRLKDWEKFDVSRYVDIGCVSPLEGSRTIEVDPINIEHYTISKDLQKLMNDDPSRAICLFHAPPYKTYLDRADLDGRIIDHVQVDMHVGSIAIKNFIESEQPRITLHGHIHESSRITGHWQQKIKGTFSYSAAWDGTELALVKFDPEFPEKAERILLE